MLVSFPAIKGVDKVITMKKVWKRCGSLYFKNSVDPVVVLVIVIVVVEVVIVAVGCNSLACLRCLFGIFFVSQDL